jgi:hypothetical protein
MALLVFCCVWKEWGWIGSISSVVLYKGPGLCLV